MSERYIFFLSAGETFFNINRKLDHKTRPDKGNKQTRKQTVTTFVSSSSNETKCGNREK